MKGSTAIRVLGTTLVMLVLTLAACGGQASVPVGGDAPQEADAEPVGQPAAGEGQEGGPGGEDPANSEGNFAPIEQRIVKTGEITLEVTNVAETLGRVRALVAELNGYVGGSQAGTLEERATLTARMPAPAFDTALARLHELDAEVIAEATREQDVTGQVVDLAARIDNCGRPRPRTASSSRGQRRSRISWPCSRAWTRSAARSSSWRRSSMRSRARPIFRR